MPTITYYRRSLVHHISKVLLWFFFTFLAACYHCFSSDASLEPKVRTQLGTQQDVFFMPFTSRSSSCSEKVDPNQPGIEGQLCSSSPLCVTLTPNIENSSFVVRGCLEYTLRHNLKKENIHNEGCYMVRSLSSRYPSNFTMEYVLCVCNGDYCNGAQPPDFVPGPLLFSGETPEGHLQLEVSSSTFKLFAIIWTLILLRILF
ncbi:unnamed protein product [Angiostrongylus costaricensis]|uniref:Uncharacterized protein n=1 Tax=Angiostrongylus costaricensis TaxID=334426 RepID=A0A3P7H0U2_ANGCS|nr:unnamed protein product [Angiostrongylus costaricensis]